VHGDDAVMIAKLGHRLRLALEPRPARAVEQRSLDLRNRHLPIQALVLGEVDTLAGALPEQPRDPVAPTADLEGTCDGGGRSRGDQRCLGLLGRRSARSALSPCRSGPSRSVGVGG